MKRIIPMSLAILLSGTILSACAPKWHVMDASTHHSPRSAQVELKKDWFYEIKPGIPKYFGKTPLELGQIAYHASGFLYVATSDGKVLSIDNKSGKLLWENEYTSAITAGPVLHQNFIYIADGSGLVRKLDAFTGQSLWEYATGAPVERSISADAQTVVAVNANNRVFVINAKDGSLRWKRERARVNDFVIYGQPPALISGDSLIVGFSDGYVVSYDLMSGQASWARELSPNLRFKDICGQIIRNEDTLFVATAAGGIYALNLSDGETRWIYEVADVAGISHFQDSLFVSSNNGLLKLDAASGELIWHNKVQDKAALSSMAIGKKHIYVNSTPLGLIVIDRKSGETRHVVNPGSSFSTSPVIEQNQLFLLSNKSVVYRLIIEDEPLV